MARVVIIDPDLQSRRQLAQLLADSPHDIEAFSSEAAALAGWGSEDPSLLFVAMGPDGEDAEDLWGTLESLGAREVVWTGAVRNPVESLLEDGHGVGFLPTPPVAARVQAFLSRLTGQVDANTAAEDWSGLSALRRINGNARRFPLARTLFLAHRIGATGRITVSGGGTVSVLGLQGGKVVGWEGLPGLLARGLGVVDDGGPADLMGQLGQFIGQGTPPDEAMAAAATGLGLWVADRVDARGLSVRWTDEPWTAAPVPLPRSLTQVLTSGLSSGRPAAVVRRAYGARRNSAVEATPPTDSPQAQWGLPPSALRLVRLAERAPSLGTLLGAAGGESDQLWSALDLVLQLGLIALDETERVAPAPAAAPVEEPDEDEVAEDDPEVQALETALEEMKGAEPWQILGVETAEQASVLGLDTLFFERSAAYHPDRFVQKSARARRIAATLFARVSDARESLRDTDNRIELVERLRAAEAGKPWASAADKQTAKLSYRKGMVELKRQAWTAAWPLLQETRQTDPTEVRYTIDALHAGWRAGVLEPEKVVSELLTLPDLNRGEQAEVFALAGEVMLRSSLDEDKAYDLLQKAVDRNPDLTDAKRRLRLREMRRQKEAEEARKRGGLRGLFGGWGNKGGDESGG